MIHHRYARIAKRNGLLVCLVLLAGVTTLRIAAASRFPLAGDEAYYWEWSRRLAFGYVDHPPMVAWTIAAFDAGARELLRLRAGFLVCGIVASVAAWDFVKTATGSNLRAALAALAINVTPLGIIAFGLATPDGPFLAMWMLGLACTLRAIKSGNVGWWIAAGVAVGAAAMARVFAVSLLAGIVWVLAGDVDARTRSLRGAILGAVAGFAVTAPYVVWNALHGWTGLEFAVVGRHHFTAPSLRRFLETLVGALAVGALFLAPLVVRPLLSKWNTRSVAVRLLLGSAAPLAAVLLVLSLFEPVELYWFAGPIMSLIVLAFAVPMPADVLRRWLVAGLAPTVLVAVVALMLACAPPAFIVRLATALPRGVSTQSALEIYSDRPLSMELRQRYRNAIVVTDEYGLSSLLDFYGGIPPYVIGYNAEGREALRWLKAPRMKETIYLDHVELSRRPDMVRILRTACGTLEPMPGIAVREGPQLVHAFSLSRCRDFDSRGVAILDRR